MSPFFFFFTMLLHFSIDLLLLITPWYLLVLLVVNNFYIEFLRKILSEDVQQVCWWLYLLMFELLHCKDIKWAQHPICWISILIRFWYGFFLYYFNSLWIFLPVLFNQTWLNWYGFWDKHARIDSSYCFEIWWVQKGPM